MKVFLADSKLLSIGKSWDIFPIKQKLNTMAAFVDSKNYQNQISLLKPKSVYHRAELLMKKEICTMVASLEEEIILVSNFLLNKKNCRCIKFLFNWKDFYRYSSES